MSDTDNGGADDEYGIVDDRECTSCGTPIPGIDSDVCPECDWDNFEGWD